MPFIKLSQLVDSKRKEVFVSTEQIVLVGEPGAMGPGGSSAHIRLTNGDVYVSETIKEVMDRIPPPAAGV